VFFKRKGKQVAKYLFHDVQLAQLLIILYLPTESPYHQ